jgi:nucleoside-diphosphate-sugar epimerase
MKYFVTGATGFIGGRVARMLVEAGHTVITIARNPAKAGDLVKLGVGVHKGDITDKDSMRGPMTGVDGVYHIAAWYEVGAADKTMARHINVDGTRNVLELMQELKIPKGVYTSTLGVFSDTHGKIADESYRHTGTYLTEYEHTKADAHYQVALPMMQQGLPLVIVQPGVVYGPGDTSSVRSTLLDYLQGKLPMMPKETAFCWAHVDDIARGHILAMEKGRVGETYIIAGERYTFIDAIQLAEKLTGIPAPKMQAAPGMMKAMAVIMGVVEKVVPLPESMRSESLRTIAGTTYTGDNSKARRELGYNPRPLAEGLRETLEHEMKLLGMETNTQRVGATL